MCAASVVYELRADSVAHKGEACVQGCMYVWQVCINRLMSTEVTSSEKEPLGTLAHTMMFNAPAAQLAVSILPLDHCNLQLSQIIIPLYFPPPPPKKVS